MKKFSFTKCGSSRYFLRVLWQFLRTRRSRSNFGGLAVAAAGGEMRSNYFKNRAYFSDLHQKNNLYGHG